MGWKGGSKIPLHDRADLWLRKWTEQVKEGGEGGGIHFYIWFIDWKQTMPAWATEKKDHFKRGK